MQKNIALSIILSAGATSAFAGTMGTVQSANDFDGFYAGLGAGFTTIYNQNTKSSSVSGLGNVFSDSVPRTDTAALFSGNIGYGAMFNQNTYLGVKGSIYYKPGENSDKEVYFGDIGNIADFTDNMTVTRSMQPFYNIDAVLGYEIFPHILPFVEGGLSFSNIQSHYVNHAVAYTLTTSVDYNQSGNLGQYRTGYNVGIGANYLVQKNWYLYSELLYNHFGSSSATRNTPLPAAGFTKSLSITDNNQAVFFVVGASYLFSM